MTSSLLQIRVQALVCLGKLVPNLESWMITEQILPTLPKISSKEPGLLMAILGSLSRNKGKDGSLLGIYKLSYENSNIGVSKDQLAKSALPFLISTSIENTLNLGQFEQYMTLIKAMMAKVEAEQRSRLQQLSAGQEEQRYLARNIYLFVSFPEGFRISTPSSSLQTAVFLKVWMDWISVEDPRLPSQNQL